jgi:hypothetical protein
MTTRGRFAAALAAGLGAGLPWLVREVGARWAGDGRPLPLWVPALAVPAAMAGALLALAAARRVFPALRGAPALPLVGGATLGFVLGRMLVQPVLRSPASAARAAAAVVIVLAVSVLLAYAAEKATARPA